ncbi:MAG: hypothetical protein QM760_00170 [Nibricoccus sp.]
MDAIDAGAGCGEFAMRGGGEALGGMIDAADRVDDPEFVTRGGTTVGAAVTGERG